MPRQVLILFCVVLSLLPINALTQPTLQQKIEQERVKQAQIQARLHQKRYQLHTVMLRENDLQSQLDRTNAAISTVNGRLDDLDGQHRSTEAKIAWNTVQLNAAQRSLQRQNDALKRRLVSIYEYGDLGYLDVLLSAHSFSEFTERWEDLRLLIAANQRTVRDRRATEQRVATIQDNLERDRLELESQEQAQQQARTQLDGLADERRSLVTLTDEQRHGIALQVDQMEELSNAQEATLEALVLQLQQELEARRRHAAGIAGIIPPPSEGAPSELSWPATGPITSPFGYRANPFNGSADFHPGIDIGIDTGTTVRAAADGTVIMAEWYGGYGNYILIDHGGGLSTGYGHLSRFYVSVGQQVQRGQAIAASGSTGYSTGPHLHFEVRKNGKPVPPLPYLR